MTDSAWLDPQLPRPDLQDDAPSLTGTALLAHIRRVLASEDKQIRWGALGHLQGLPDHPGMVDLLIELTHHADIVVVLKAVEVLTEHRVEAGFNAIARLLDAGPRYAVFSPRIAYSLVRINPCKAIPHLLNSMDDNLSMAQRVARSGGLRAALRDCPDEIDWLLAELGRGSPKIDPLITEHLKQRIDDLPLDPLLAALHRCADRSLIYSTPSRMVLRRFAVELRNRRPGAARAAVDLLEALEA